MSILKCMIIDDDEMARKIILRHCDKIEQLEVVGVFDSGLKALKSIEEEAVDLLFLDVEMPDLTGIELIESLITLPNNLIHPLKTIM